MKLMNIYSGIERKWHKDASLSFYTRSGEVEMGMTEEEHILVKVLGSTQIFLMLLPEEDREESEDHRYSHIK
jgi:hypothetical protein